MTDPTQPLPQPPLKDQLEQALKNYHADDISLDLAQILPNLARQVAVAQPDHGQSPQRLTKQILLTLLDLLADVDGDAAQLLRRFYLDDEKGFTVANSLDISESSFFRRRRAALETLTAATLRHEQEAAKDHVARLESRLENPTYQQLVGVDNLQTELVKLLYPQSDIRIVCLSGLGGLGKTALADALARQMIRARQVMQVVWVTARQERFATWGGTIEPVERPILTPDELIAAIDHQLHGQTPPRPSEEILSGLKARLAQEPHLIILDNLETVEDYKTLFELLHELSQQAQILLTSRLGFIEQAGIYIAPLTELSQPDAEALIRYEAVGRGLDDLAEAPAAIMDDIYQIVGGNPLALKLIIGQMHVRSLPTVLTDLKEARGRKSEALYEYIYRQAWELLDEQAQRLLIAMPLVAASGTSVNHLRGATGLSREAVYDALEILIRLSLVMKSGSFQEEKYQIHRLTESFLHQQVTKWAAQ